MRLSDFDYAFPKELIAQEPLPRRDASRLLVLHRDSGRVEHRRFTDLPEYVRPGDLFVLNDTKVVPARIECWRTTGGRVEALLVQKLDDRRWQALLDTGGRPQIGEKLKVAEREWATITDKQEDRWTLEFGVPVEPILERHGKMPLPPYIRREATAGDAERYQTVFAARPGAIAAPTAGLHFTPEILARLPTARLTLHVGTGTFKPVKSERIEEHRMDAEIYEIPSETLAAARQAARVVAVGTTACRALETWAATTRASGTTELFIHSPFDFKIVRALVTNFHLPKTTLLMLVSAFAGWERIRKAYDEAIERKYRLFSYGDAMLIL